jgi:hypothetical protein
MKIIIESVKEYNAKQHGAGMMFLNTDGSKCKRGFVVTINGVSRRYATLNEIKNINGADFETKETLACYSHGGPNTIMEEMNN